MGKTTAAPLSPAEQRAADKALEAGVEIREGAEVTIKTDTAYLVTTEEGARHGFYCSDRAVKMAACTTGLIVLLVFLFASLLLIFPPSWCQTMGKDIGMWKGASSYNSEGHPDYHRGNSHGYQHGNSYDDDDDVDGHYRSEEYHHHRDFIKGSTGRGGYEEDDEAYDHASGEINARKHHRHRGSSEEQETSEEIKDGDIKESKGSKERERHMRWKGKNDHDDDDDDDDDEEGEVVEDELINDRKSNKEHKKHRESNEKEGKNVKDEDNEINTSKASNDDRRYRGSREKNESSNDDEDKEIDEGRRSNDHGQLQGSSENPGRGNDEESEQAHDSQREKSGKYEMGDDHRKDEDVNVNADKMNGSREDVKGDDVNDRERSEDHDQNQESSRDIETTDDDEKEETDENKDNSNGSNHRGQSEERRESIDNSKGHGKAGTDNDKESNEMKQSPATGEEHPKRMIVGIDVIRVYGNSKPEPVRHQESSKKHDRDDEHAMLDVIDVRKSRQTDDQQRESVGQQGKTDDAIDDHKGSVKYDKSQIGSDNHDGRNDGEEIVIDDNTGNGTRVGYRELGSDDVKDDVGNGPRGNDGSNRLQDSSDNIDKDDDDQTASDGYGEVNNELDQRRESSDNDGDDVEHSKKGEDKENVDVDEQQDDGA